ncbi:MAG: site-specific integrase, partial [Limnohabitans sp.]
MASFRQRGGKWQARVLRDGYPDQAKTFESRADAERWARSVESSIDKGQFIDINEAQRTTLGDVIERYLAEVTLTMKSALADTIRLSALMRRPIARLSMANLSAARVAAFRDERLKQVSAGTVIRELAYLSSIINHARREWGINVPNPVQMVRKPSSPPARARVLSNEEVLRLL